MIIKNQRPDIKIVNEKRRSKWYHRWNLSSQNLKSLKIEKEEHTKKKSQKTY